MAGMREIHKYAIPKRFGETVLRLPLSGATVLDVQIQHNELQLWAMVKPHQEPIDVEFLILPTGVPTALSKLKDYMYLKTIQDGPIVFHIYIKPTNLAQ